MASEHDHGTLHSLAAFIYTYNRDHVLDSKGVDRDLQELYHVAKKQTNIVCDLSEGRLKLDDLQKLPSELGKINGATSVALDLSTAFSAITGKNLSQ